MNAFSHDRPPGSEKQRSARWGVPNTAAVSIPHEIAFEDISHEIDGASILDDVSIRAGSGTVNCLLGPSGSGKTTLLRIAAGLERQTAGRVLMDGREIGGPATFIAPEKRGIGLVFQDYALFPHLSIIDNVTFGLSHLKKRQRRDPAMQMLERVGLADRAFDFPHQLSGGEQQRVALARAMAPRPGIILMDEPFSGLDSRLRDTVREETLGILRETRATSIIVTHDPEEALRMGDQIALLHNGKLAQIGTGRSLYFRPKSLFAASFFSELNYFEGRVLSGRVETPLGPLPVNGVRDGDPAVAAIRINAISVEEGAVPQESRRAEGRVVSTHFTGDHDHLRVGVSGSDQALRVRVPAGTLSAAALEGRVSLTLTPMLEGCFVFPAG